MERKTVNFSEKDARAIGEFFQQGTPEREKLAGMVGEDAPIYSDSSVVRALVLLGAEAVRDKLLEEGYAALAAQRDEEDEKVGLLLAEESMRLMEEAYRREES